MKKMKIKIFVYIIIIVCFVVCLVVIRKICKKHVHEYDNNCDAICNVCQEKRDVQDHQWNDATCKPPKTCKDCEHTEGAVLEHKPEEDDGDCKTDVLCSVCHTICVEGINHNYSDEWEKSDEEHWLICQNEGCNKTSSLESHSIEVDNDCSTAAICKCRYIVIASKEHVAQNDDGNCTTDINVKIVM